MGWFDFLKKGKKVKEEGAEKVKEEGAEKAPPSDTRSEVSRDAPKPGLNISQETETLLQQEASLLQIMDGLYDNPLKYMMQKKAQDEVVRRLTVFIESRPATKEYWSKPDKDVVQATRSLMQDGDAFARGKGLKRSPQRFMMIINIAILGGILGLFMVLSLVGLAEAAMNFYLFIMCAVCFIPNLIQKWMGTKLFKFQEANAGEFIKQSTSKLEIIHDLVQYLLADVRETLANAGNDASKFRFRLWNSDYKDIKVMDSKIMPGMNKTFYEVRFLKDDEDANEPEEAGGVDGDIDFDVDSKDAAESGDDVDEKQESTGDDVDDEDEDEKKVE